MRIDCPRGEDGPRDPEVVREADLLELERVHDVAEQLAGLLVVQKQCRAIAVQHARRLRHHSGKQGRELELRRQVGDDVQELDLALALVRHPLEPMKRLQGDGALRGHALEHREVARVERAVDLVQDLRHSDRLALAVPDRRAHERGRRVIGLLVDVTVEAGIRVGVLHDLATAAVEDRPGDAEIVHQPDLPAPEAGGDVRVELAGVLVVQEDRASVGSGLLDRRLEQGLEYRVE